MTEFLVSRDTVISALTYVLERDPDDYDDADDDDDFDTDDDDDDDDDENDDDDEDIETWQVNPLSTVRIRLKLAVA